MQATPNHRAYGWTVVQKQQPCDHRLASKGLQGTEISPEGCIQELSARTPYLKSSTKMKVMTCSMRQEGNQHQLIVVQRHCAAVPMHRAGFPVGPTHRHHTDENQTAGVGRRQDQLRVVSLLLPCKAWSIGNNAQRYAAPPSLFAPVDERAAQLLPSAVAGLLGVVGAGQEDSARVRGAIRVERAHQGDCQGHAQADWGDDACTEGGRELAGETSGAASATVAEPQQSATKLTAHSLAVSLPPVLLTSV